MPIAHVQTLAAAQSGATSASVTMSTTTGRGIIIGAVIYTASAFVSVTDSLGHTWTLTAGPILANSGSGIGSVRQYYHPNITGNASHVFTVNCSPADYPTIFVTEISGQATSGLLDQNATGTTAGAEVQSLTTGSTPTTTQANEILIATFVSNVGASGNIWTAGSLYTLGASITDGAIYETGCQEWRIVSATGAYTAAASMSGTSNMAAVLGTYKEAVVAAGLAARRNRQLMSRSTGRSRASLV